MQQKSTILKRPVMTHHRAQNTPQRDESKVTQIVRVAVYCRVSSDSSQQELSLDAQKAAFERLIAKDPDKQLIEIYADQGISGCGITKRHAFRRMMHDCLAGKIDLVMTKSISRFSRNTGDFLDCVRQLKQKGIGVYFEKENLNTMDEKTEVILSILATLGQEEMRSHSQNIRWGHQKRNASGKPSMKPIFGYKREGEHWVINQPQAEIVRDIFTMAFNGMDTIAIARELADMRIHDEKGLWSWKPTRITSILKNEIYIGDVRTNKHYVDDYLTGKAKVNNGQVQQYYIENHHPPIIERAIFLQVQERFKNRKNSSRAIGEQKSRPVFSRKIHCTYCGRNYNRITNDRYASWICPTHKIKASTCPSRPITEGTLERVTSILLQSKPDFLKDAIIYEENDEGGMLSKTQREQLKQKLDHITHTTKGTFIFHWANGEYEEVTSHGCPCN